MKQFCEEIEQKRKWEKRCLSNRLRYITSMTSLYGNINHKPSNFTHNQSSYSGATHVAGYLRKCNGDKP